MEKTHSIVSRNAKSAINVFFREAEIHSNGTEKRRTRAWIPILSNIGGSLGRSPELGRSLVAGRLGRGDTTGWGLEEVAGTRGVLQVLVSVLITESSGKLVVAVKTPAVVT